MNIVVILQARVGSTRLPGKVLKKVMGRELLALQMERVLRANFPDRVVVATTILPEDNRIVAVCERYGYDYYRGHPTDLLDRHFKAGQEYSADIIIKIPSDCPLIDPEVIDKVIEYYIENSDSFDYVSNLHPPTFPDGNDIEIMAMETLHNAWRHAEEAYELEHTTPYIWEHPEIFRVGNVRLESGSDYSNSHRFTLDYTEDYEFIKRIYEELYPNNPEFSMGDILELLQNKPEIKELNSKFLGEGWYMNHLETLRNKDRYELVLNNQ